jgi:hypothetical protein
MSNYIITKLKNQLSLIDNLKNGNKEHELEVRFGLIKSLFDPKLTPQIFSQVFNKMMDSDVKNQIIVDWIYSNYVTKSFFQRENYNVNRSKFIKKIIFNNNFKELTTDFNISAYNNENVSSYESVNYILKEKKSQYTKDTLRFSYSLEHDIDIENKENIDLLHKDNKPFQVIRLKNRYSKILNKYLRLDMSIVKSYTPQRLLEDQDIEYSIEIEIINKDNIDELLKSVREFCSDILLTYFDKKKFLFNLASMNPQTLEGKDLTYLKKYQYTVTDKADGERVYIIFFDNKIFLVNPKTNDILYEADNYIKELNDTIIDGEYLKEFNEFLAFDLLFYKYKDFRDKNLTTRLGQLKNINYYLSKIKDVKITLKKFYFDDIFTNAKKIWNDRKNLFKYHLDGLIFTPIEQVYTSDIQEIPILKWKESLSIDVRVEYNFRENFTYFHHGSRNTSSRPWNLYPQQKQKQVSQMLRNDHNYRDIISKNDNQNDIYHLRWVSNKRDLLQKINNLNLGKVKNGKLFLGINGTPQIKSNIRSIWNKYDIVEYEFDFEKNSWYAIRKRTFDKEKPNAYLTIESVVRSILNYISIDELFELKNKNVENIGELYNMTSDTIMRKNWRKFNNHAKNMIFKKVNDLRPKKNNYHMELACGKLGDLLKWINNGYKNILAIDSSKDEIYGKNGAIDRLIGLGFKQNKYFFEKNDMRVTVVNGDVTKNFRNGESGLSDKEKKKLQMFFNDTSDDWEGFNTISIMFAIHYFFGDLKEGEEKWNPDKNKFEDFMKNVTENLKYDGIVFGTYLNGNNIKEDMDFIYNGEMMYRITHLHNKEVPKDITYDKFFKQKSINTIEIENEVWGNNVKISEPKINKNILGTAFENFGFKPIQENTTFEQHYNTFQEMTKRSLSDVEKRLVFINNSFIFSRINIEKIINEINELLDTNIYEKNSLVLYLIENVENGNLDDRVKDLFQLLF